MPNYHTSFTYSYLPFQEQDLLVTWRGLTKDAHQRTGEIIQIVDGYILAHITRNLWIREFINIFDQQPMIDGQTQFHV